MAAVVNDRDKGLSGTTRILTNTSVTISGTGEVFTRAKNGGPVSPATITLTALPNGFTAPTYAWEYALYTAPNTWIPFGNALASQTITGNKIV